MARGSRKPLTLRKDRTGSNPVLVGALVLLAAVIVTYFGFTKDWPFSRGFQYKAVFTSSNSIRTNSPVRIAGVNVGKVVKVEGQDGTDNAVITMEVKDEGLPIHKDARLKIKPRIFLEGNFFVDLQPGTPSAPTISDGDTIPVGQTATPVQLDQVLTALQQDTRRSLQSLLIELGSSLTRRPTPAENADQSIYTQDKSAAEALNNSIVYGEPALKNTAIVNEALQGIVPSDLTGLVKGLSETGTKLAENDAELAALVENFNTTMAAIASQQNAVRASVRELGPTVTRAYASLGSLNDALPSVRRFSLEIIPGVEQTQPTIDAVTPWIAQARPLVSKSELGGLVADTQPATASLASASASTVPLIKQGDLLAKCVSKVILPAGDVKLQDGPSTTGKENYKEFWYSMVGLAGEGENFDGNGQFVHFQTGGGGYSVKLSGGNLGAGGELFGNSVGQPLGTSPAWTQTKPPFVSNQPCYTQARTRAQLTRDFNTAPGPSDAG